jgi:hypothetical protein
LERRKRWKIENKLSGSLDRLSEDVRAVLYSPNLYRFNVQHLRKWRLLQEYVKLGCAHLAEPLRVQFDVIDSVVQDGVECYFVRGVETFEFQDFGSIQITGFMD